MRTVGIRTLKNKLSEYVRIAEHGETVLISDRDRVVAELRPPQETRARSVSDAVLADLLRTGLLSPALVGSGAPPSGPAVLSWPELQAELDDDRGDR